MHEFLSTYFVHEESCFMITIEWTPLFAYVLPLYAGQLSKEDKARLDSLFWETFKRGFCFQKFSMEEL